jgi:hypothetical protein
MSFIQGKGFVQIGGVSGDGTGITDAKVFRENLGISDGTANVRYLRINADQSTSLLSAAQLLSDLIPDRVLYIDDLAAGWFNGSNEELAGVIPLTAAQSVIGTKIRVRGFVKTLFQGTAPAFPGDLIMVLAFDVAENSATPFEGVLIQINAGECSHIDIEAELELVAATGANYKLAKGSNTPTYTATATPTGGSFQRWGNEEDATGYVIDPSVEGVSGGSAGIRVMLQVAGGVADASTCRVWVDLSYDIIE